MGVTSTLTYLGPFLALPMTITVRLFVLGLVQVLMCLMETAETILRQVSIAKENTVVVHTSLLHSTFEGSTPQTKNMDTGGVSDCID